MAEKKPDKILIELNKRRNQLNTIINKKTLNYENILKMKQPCAQIMDRYNLIQPKMESALKSADSAEAKNIKADMVALERAYVKAASAYIQYTKLERANKTGIDFLKTRLNMLDDRIKNYSKN